MPKKLIKIFKAGKYPQGDVSEKHLDVIVKNFSKYGDVPLTVDHKHDGPAYGWVDTLKRDGEFLVASFRDVTDEMKGWVSKKQYQGRSAELVGMSDGNKLRLRGLTMLGAASPQINMGGVAEFKEVNTHEPVLAVRFEANNDTEMFVEEEKVETFEQKDDVIKIPAVKSDEPLDQKEWKFQLQDQKIEDEKDKEIIALQKKLKSLENSKSDAETKMQMADNAQFIELMVKEYKLLPRSAENKRIFEFMLMLNDEQKQRFQDIVIHMPTLHSFTDKEESKSLSTEDYTLSLGSLSPRELVHVTKQYMEKNKIEDYTVAHNKVMEMRLQESA